jgi:hypothetical protein
MLINNRSKKTTFLRTNTRSSKLVCYYYNNIASILPIQYLSRSTVINWVKIVLYTLFIITLEVFFLWHTWMKKGIAAFTFLIRYDFTRLTYQQPGGGYGSWLQINPATFYWHACTKSGKWALSSLRISMSKESVAKKSKDNQG